MLTILNTALLCVVAYLGYKIYEKMPGKEKSSFQDDMENFGNAFKKGAQDAYESVKENAPKAAGAVKENAARAYTTMKSDLPGVYKNITKNAKKMVADAGKTISRATSKVSGGKKKSSPSSKSTKSKKTKK